MSPEHAAELAKRGIVYTPWKRDEYHGYTCIEGCGIRLDWPNSRCMRCKLSRQQMLAERKALRRQRDAKRAA